MSKRRNYEDLGEVELPEAVAREVEAAIGTAERELAEARTNVTSSRLRPKSA